jgi:copper homeostasis protein (lipoprotein)
MRKIYRNFILLIFIADTMSCNPKKVATSPEKINTNSLAPIRDKHNASNSIDWAGTYLGTLPCADCEGIETELTLKHDNSYSLKTRYIGNGDKTFEENGTFSWNDEGNTIILTGLANRPSQYFVGENKIIQLDLAGNKITGTLSENYILKKSMK